MTIPEIQTQLKKAQKEQDVMFTDRGHTYAMNGEYLTGVTTILNQKAKDFLIGWAVKMMYTFMKGKLKLIKTLSAIEYEELILEGKKAHTTYSMKAARFGTKGHDIMKKYVKARIEGKGASLKIENKEMQRTFDSFIQWETGKKVQWIASEEVVANWEHKVGGTIDALAMVDGVFTVIDFKFSKQLGEDVFLQTAGYQLCLTEMGLIPEQRMAIRFPKNGDDIEPYRIPTPIEFDTEVFLGFRQAHRWNLYVGNNLKEPSGKLKII